MDERDLLLVDLWYRAMWPNRAPEPGSELYERLREAVADIDAEYADKPATHR